jgi:hypothetical protein
MVTAEPVDPPGTVLLSRVGPLQKPVAFDGMRVIQPDDEACKKPQKLSVGAWWTEEALSAGDPNDELELRVVNATKPLPGYVQTDVSLPALVDVPAGAFLWLARGLGDGECGARMADEAEGTEALMWRPEGSGWVALEGQLVMTPLECSAH